MAAPDPVRRVAKRRLRLGRGSASLEFEALRPPARSDVLRHLVLFRYGGVYADMVEYWPTATDEMNCSGTVSLTRSGLVRTTTATFVPRVT